MLVPVRPGIMNKGGNSLIVLGPKVGSCTNSGLGGALLASFFSSSTELGKSSWSSIKEYKVNAMD